jgi:large subunit ribosomal protein L31
MKKGIHPELKLIKVTCACGNVFEALSIRDSIRIEICSACHPFYTGKKKIVDTAGRVERFMSRAGKGATYGTKGGPKPKEAATKRDRAK